MKPHAWKCNKCVSKKNLMSEHIEKSLKDHKCLQTIIYMWLLCTVTRVQCQKYVGQLKGVLWKKFNTARLSLGQNLKIPARENEFHRPGYQPSFLSWVFCFSLCAHYHRNSVSHMVLYGAFLLYLGTRSASYDIFSTEWSLRVQATTGTQIVNHGMLRMEQQKKHIYLNSSSGIY